MARSLKVKHMEYYSMLRFKGTAVPGIGNKFW